MVTRQDQEERTTHQIERDLDKVLGALANLFASDGDARAVAILAMASASVAQTGYESNWNERTYFFTVYLQVPQTLYHQLGTDLESIEEQFKERVREIMRLYTDQWIEKFVITTALEHDPEWREKAKAYVAGQGISNQGRARSDNLAPRQADGLLFRSQPEINLYRAFKSLGVSFAPLPVFVRGGDTYRRIEPDFVVLKDGVIMIVEVDGDTVHKETPLDAHNRTTMMVHEGAHVERVNANDCANAEKALACAQRLLGILKQLKASR
jgi:hypothetical protein